MDAKDVIKQRRAQILARKMAVGNPNDRFTGPECKAVLDMVTAHKDRVQSHNISVDRFASMIHNSSDSESVTVTISELRWLVTNAEDVRRKLTALFFEKDQDQYQGNN